MGGNYSVNSRAVGELLTAAKYVADHSVHRDSMTPAGVDDYSASLTQMRQTSSPGNSGSEILPTHLGGEIERLRFVVQDMKRTAQWYGPGWGVQDRNVNQSVLSNSTVPTAIYGTTVPAISTTGGFQIMTGIEVLQNTGSVQQAIFEVLYGTASIFSVLNGFNSSATHGGMILRAHILARGTANLVYGAGESLGSPNGRSFASNPRIGVTTTTPQVLQVRVQLMTASPLFVCTHTHTEVWRL